MEDVYKFDCHPQDNAEESACLKRGCCWSFTDKQFVPFCYYPPDFALYTFVNVSHMTDGHYNGVVRITADKTFIWLVFEISKIIHSLGCISQASCSFWLSGRNTSAETRS